MKTKKILFFEITTLFPELGIYIEGFKYAIYYDKRCKILYINENVYQIQPLFKEDEITEKSGGRSSVIARVIAIKKVAANHPLIGFIKKMKKSIEDQEKITKRMLSHFSKGKRE